MSGVAGSNPGVPPLFGVNHLEREVECILGLVYYEAISNNFPHLEC